MNYIKILCIIITIGILITGCSTQNHIEGANKDMLWTLDTQQSMPESIYPDPESGKIFISHIEGSPGDKDGKGRISVINKTGQEVSANWAIGLNAPKGLRSFKNKLWVSDIDRVLAFDTSSGKRLHQVLLPKAKFLNDVAVDEQGTIYVSDMLDNTIYVISPKLKVSKIQNTQLASPNGLLVKGNNLYVATWGQITDASTFTAPVMGKLLKIDLKTHQIVELTKEPFGHFDGLEIDRDGNFLVSDWVNGQVYRFTINPDGSNLVETLFEGGLENGTADIGYIAESNMLLIPSMLKGTVVGKEL